MGFFSWKTCDTNESITNRWSSAGTFTVHMIDDKGNVWTEENYDGYGIFGGKDYYALVDEMNGGDGDRIRGIDLELSKKKDVKLPKFVRLLGPKWGDLRRPKHCPRQGYFL